MSIPGKIWVDVNHAIVTMPLTDVASKWLFMLAICSSQEVSNWL